MRNIKSMKLYTRVERERHQWVHREAKVQARGDFYSLVDSHLQSGKLGDLSICAKRQE